MQVQLRFLGSGGAFADSETRENLPMLTFWNEHNKPYRMFVDFGCDAKHSLERAKLSYNDVDVVHISHLHSDHIGGLEKLGFFCYFGRLPKPKLLISEYLVGELWESLRGGMRILEDREMTLYDYFDVIKLPETVAPLVLDLFGTKELFKLTAVPVPHIRQLNPMRDGMSNGLFLQYQDFKIFFTTDARHCPEYLSGWYNQADVIVQDCNDNYNMSPVHAPLEALKTLPQEIRDKMILSHLSGRGRVESYMMFQGRASKDFNKICYQG